MCYNNHCLLLVMFLITVLMYTVSQKKLDLLAWVHLRRSNFFWDTLYVCISSGGYDGDGRKDILEFNHETESWTVIGAMKEPRHAHSVSVVSIEDYEKWCN